MCQGHQVQTHSIILLHCHYTMHDGNKFVAVTTPSTPPISLQYSEASEAWIGTSFAPENLKLSPEFIHLSLKLRKPPVNLLFLYNLSPAVCPLFSWTVTINHNPPSSGNQKCWRAQWSRTGTESCGGRIFPIDISVHVVWETCFTSPTITDNGRSTLLHVLPCVHNFLCLILFFLVIVSKPAIPQLDLFDKWLDYSHQSSNCRSPDFLDTILTQFCAYTTKTLKGFTQKQKYDSGKFSTN